MLYIVYLKTCKNILGGKAVNNMKTLKVDKRSFLFFVISIMFNSVGNALTVSTNLGSAMWTASSVNLSHILPISFSLILFILSTMVIILNIVLLKRIDWNRIIGNFLFMVPYSYFIGLFNDWFIRFGIGNLSLPWRILIDFIGVIFMAIAISIYQRVNWVLHPLDDFMQILRFKYFKGNPVLAQWTSYSIPIVFIIISVIMTHRISAINIGTIVIILFQGKLIGLADKYVFPKLKHQHMEANV